jgi:Spy/CpxP family protein refolding chaperone
MYRTPMLFGLGILALSLLVGAGATQDGKKDKDEKKTKGILPAGFKDLNLTAEQKAKVYSIQGDYKVKIGELDKKIKELKSQEKKDIFGVLTKEQQEKYLKAQGIDVPVKDKKDEPKDKKDDVKDKK